MAEINVTPLIDVVLVLLVVFMVITPMLQSGMPVELPEATQSTTVSDVGQHIVVSVNKKGEWYVQQTQASDEDSLIELINVELTTKAKSKATETSEATRILLKGDAKIEYGKVREVMDIIGKANITTVFLATAEE